MTIWDGSVRTVDEWHVGDPADWGDSVGVPDIGYMGYLQDDEDEDAPRHVTRSQSLRREAWRLRNDGRLNDALSKINESLKYGDNWEGLNIKAIILEDMGDYEEALHFYDRSLNISSARFVKDNKARLLERIAERQRYSLEYGKALDNINLALKITSNEDDALHFLAGKRDILDAMGRHREAYVCNKLANRQNDLVDKFERQSKILKDTTDMLICISGTRFYRPQASLAEGTVVDLVREPDHPHDPDAIRVELGGQIVGYVANSRNTLIDEVKSAFDIKDMDFKKAKVLFVFMERYIVCKLL